MIKELSRDILQCIGNTSLVPLRKIAPRNGGPYPSQVGE